MADGTDGISQLVREVVSSLSIEYESGVDIVSRLLLGACKRTFDVLASQNESEGPDLRPACFETLIALADEQINNVDFHLVSPMWLSLYVDTYLLSALNELVIATRQGGIDKTSRDRSVRKLDTAIIVGGAGRLKRMNWIQRAIKLAQVDTTPHEASQQNRGDEKPCKRRRLDTPPELLSAPRVIPSLGNPPDIERYLTNYRDAPFILRGYLNAKSGSIWPASSKWSDPEYLLSRVGRSRCVPVEEGSSYDNSDWGQRIVPFEDFLARAGFFGATVEASFPKTRPMYLAQHSLFRQFPELERDMSLPDYVKSRPAAPAGFPSYLRPDTEDGVIVNVWVGSGSGEIVSPAHTDPYYNCYAQVLGQKRVWVAPPTCGPYMACHGADLLEGDEKHVASQYMNNTSTIPLLRSDTTSDDLASKYPLFKQHVWPHCSETVLEPGDLLVMPPGWWHAMRGEGSGPGWSVSMWY